MGKNANLTSDVDSVIQRLSKRINIDKAIIFGSRARSDGDEESDVDLLIISPDFRGKKFRERARGFYECSNLDFPVDFICFTPEEFEEMKDKPTIVREALEEGISVVSGEHST